MVKAAASDAVATPGRRGRAADVVRSIGRPKVAVMLVLGFSSGVPFMLFGNTLGAWLAKDGIGLGAIGFFSWAGLPYLLKFVWGAAADRLRLPLIGGLGRRRSWMIASQIGVCLGLLGMAATNPKTNLGQLALFAILTGLAGATQDTVIDAWRIESAETSEELGLLTSAYSLGFRGALICTEALIFLIAQNLGWPFAYDLFGAAMAAGLAATLLAREPQMADQVMEAKRLRSAHHPLTATIDAVAGPIVAFFRAHGPAMAALMLGMITLYHLCDYMRGPMSNPFYTVALKIDYATIAFVRGTLGLAGSLAGIALGGVVTFRMGVLRSLVIGAVVQPLGIAAFAILAWRGGDFSLISAGPLNLTAFEAIMGFDSLAIGFSGVALVSYMSTLTSLGYTATQYALLTSAMAWSGKILKGFSGEIVTLLEHGRSLLQAYALFYLSVAAIGVPAIVLCVLLARQARLPAPPQLVGQTT